MTSTQTDAPRPKREKTPRPLRLVGGHLEGPELITLAEVAELFNVRRETLWAWRRSKGFPNGVRVGTLLRFQRDAVERWILAHARRA